MSRRQPNCPWRIGTLLLGLGGCTGLSESELLDGKPCTASGACATGYVCDSTTRVCVSSRTGAASGGTGGADGGEGPAPNSGGAAGMALGGGAGGGGGANGGEGGAALAGSCGDGILDPGEECEPDGLGPCTERCTVDCANFAYGGTALTLGDGSTHCYYALIIARSWSNTALECEKHGGHLVTVHSAAEQTLVKSLLGTSTTAWIGATDGLTVNDWIAGNYAWVTEEPFAFTPSGGFNSAPAPYCTGSCGHCATVTGGAVDTWNVANCTSQLVGVCEWSPPAL